MLKNDLGKEKSIFKKILTGVIIGLLYAVIQDVSWSLVESFTLIVSQPSAAFGAVASMCFGWPAIIGCTIGGFLDTLTDYTKVSSFAFVIAVVFLYCYIAYALWTKLSGDETHRYRLDSNRRVLRFAVVVLADSIITASVKAVSMMLALQMQTVEVVKAFAAGIIDYISMTMVYGIAIMVILSLFIDRRHDPNHKFRKLYQSEKIILVSSLLVVVCNILVILTIRLGAGQEYLEIDLANRMNILSRVISLVIVSGMVFVVCSAFDRDHFLKACEKIAFCFVLILFIFNLLMIFKTQRATDEYIYNTNVIIYGIAQAVCLNMLFATVFDKHEITKNNMIFMGLILVSALHLFVSGFEYYSRAANPGSEAISFLEGAAYIFECISIGLFGRLLFVNLDITSKKAKTFTWIAQGLLLVGGITQFAQAVTAVSYLDASGDMVEHISITYIAGVLVILSYFIYLIARNADNAYARVSLLAIPVLDIIATISTVINANIYFFPVTHVLAIVCCFNSVYISRSNTFIDAEKDAMAAADIQLSMLPKDFTGHGFDNIDLYASMHPAKNVGGDFYDFYRVSDKHIVVVIADVSGKGFPAAMLMMRAITAIKNFAMAGLSVDKLVSMASDNINEHNDAMFFITGWVGLLNVQTGVMRFVNAGHNPPLIRHSDGRIEDLDTPPDLVMGFFPGNKYTKRQIKLNDGDTLFLYTDGINEAFSEYEEQYGMARLREAVSKPMENVAEMCERVRADVNDFVGAAPQFDDMTMLAITYRDSSNVKEDTQSNAADSVSFTEVLSSDMIQGIDIIGIEKPIDIEVIGEDTNAKKSVNVSVNTEDLGLGSLGIEVISSEAPVDVEVISSGEVPHIDNYVPTGVTIDDIYRKDIVDAIKVKAREMTTIIDNIPGDGCTVKFSEISGDIENIVEKRIEVDAVTSNVDDVVDQVDEYISILGADSGTQIAINVAIDEVFSNIVNYAYGNEVGKCIVELNKISDPLGVTIKFIDYGMPYNPLETDAPDPNRSIESRSQGGVGIFIVRKTMDDVQYERKYDRNILTITKYFKQA